LSRNCPKESRLGGNIFARFRLFYNAGGLATAFDFPANVADTGPVHAHEERTVCNSYKPAFATPNAELAERPSTKQIAKISGPRAARWSQSDALALKESANQKRLKWVARIAFKQLAWESTFRMNSNQHLITKKFGIDWPMLAESWLIAV
jgi:hypothetical protein